MRVVTGLLLLLVGLGIGFGFGCIVGQLSATRDFADQEAAREWREAQEADLANGRRPFNIEEFHGFDQNNIVLRELRNETGPLAENVIQLFPGSGRYD